MQVILFDGVCNLCDRIITFIEKRDKRSSFKFAPLQSGDGKLLADIYQIPVNNIDTVVYIRDNACYRKSTAVLKILTDLGGIWQLSAVFLLVPTCIRDLIYDVTARFRYKVFGRRRCYLDARNTLNNRLVK